MGKIQPMAGASSGRCWWTMAVSVKGGPVWKGVRYGRWAGEGGRGVGGSERASGEPTGGGVARYVGVVKTASERSLA